MDKRAFILVSDRVRANAHEALDEAPDGYVVTIAEVKRTNDQNAMFHAICSDIAKSGGRVLLISAHATATDEGNEIVPGLEGEFVNIRESSELMSVRRAASLVTYCLAYCDTNQIPLHETRRGGFLDQREAA